MGNVSKRDYTTGYSVSKRLLGILRELEDLDKSLVLEETSFRHSFGRIPGENEIRLWQVPRRTAEFLHFLVSLHKPRRILEIGTSAGYSAIWMADAAKNHGGVVDTIEIFEPKVLLAKKYIKSSRLPNINLLVGDAIEIARKYRSKIDMLFLDADKENYLTYFRALSRCFRKGTLVVADNAGNYGHLMKEYLEYLNSSRKATNHFLDIDNGLFLTVIKETL